MRFMLSTLVVTLSLAAGVFGQDASPALPKCLQDAPAANVDFKNTTVAEVLAFLAASCRIEIRVEGIEGTAAARRVPAVQFQQTKPAEVFAFLVRSSGLKYTTIDDKTIVVTP
jgi:hypothetical protein